MIDISDFKKLHLRAGTIVEVHDFPGANKPAYQLEIDFGPLGRKRSSAQITTLYDKTALVGMQVIAVVNFPERQIANFFSQCLVLGATDDHGNVVLLCPEKAVTNGSEVS